MNRVYFDNGATSFPKAPGVNISMSDYILNNGTNVSRGAYRSSMDASRVVYETRELLCELFNFDFPENVIFTRNITESLNILLKGLLTRADHVITSSMEHNSVIRPMNSIGCEVTRVQANAEGYINPEAIKKAIQPNTKVIMMIHGSNVCGSVNNIDAIGKIAKEKGVYFILDAAQTAGVVDIDMKKSNIDALGFTGHKSLLGPNGIGGFLISKPLSKLVKPLIEGGTGSSSESEFQPEHMPDKFESGTMNIVGIYGLNTSLKYVSSVGIKNIHDHEMVLVQYFMDHFKFDKVKIIGSKGIKNRTGVISLDFETLDNAYVSFELERKYNIETRVGMHCAPLAHKTLKTFPQGTVRVSFSYFTKQEEIDYFIQAIDQILNSAE